MRSKRGPEAAGQLWKQNLIDDIDERLRVLGLWLA
jgi:hypothetical protein